MYSARKTPRQQEATPQEPRGPASDTPVEPPRPAVPPPIVTPRNVISVSGIKGTTPEEVVKMFFENKKRSGGGPVKHLHYQPTEGRATITFHREEGTHLLFPSARRFLCFKSVWETKSVNRNPQHSNCLNRSWLTSVMIFHWTKYRVHVVRIPTRLNNILDQILTTNPNLFRNVSTVTGINHHDIITMILDVKVPMNKKKVNTV